jgi:hypothetical protein
VPSEKEHDYNGWNTLRNFVGNVGNHNLSAHNHSDDHADDDATEWILGLHDATESADLRILREQGVDMHGRRLNADDSVDDSTYGLVSCLRKCERTEHCRFVAYNEQHMNACLLLGELVLSTFKKNCGYTFESLTEFVAELEEEKKHGEPLQDEGGLLSAHANKQVKDLLSGFFIFMVRDADFQLYGNATIHGNVSTHRPQPGGTCNCLPGHNRMNDTHCKLTHESERNCTEVSIKGPITVEVSGLQVQSLISY